MTTLTLWPCPDRKGPHSFVPAAPGWAACNWCTATVLMADAGRSNPASGANAPAPLVSEAERQSARAAYATALNARRNTSHWEALDAALAASATVRNEVAR
jgi:hypothetical protein